jgi:hypothetical protein
MRCFLPRDCKRIIHSAEQEKRRDHKRRRYYGTSMASRKKGTKETITHNGHSKKSGLLSCLGWKVLLSRLMRYVNDDKRMIGASTKRDIAEWWRVGHEAQNGMGTERQKDHHQFLLC